MLGVLDFCMLIIILLINWLLNFIDGKLIWISITEFRKALTNDTVTVTQWNCTRRKWYTYIIRTLTLSKGLYPVNCQQWIIRSNGTQSMELDPMIRAWKHDTSTDHVIAMKINLSYTLSSWGGNEKLFL